VGVPHLASRHACATRKERNRGKHTKHVKAHTRRIRNNKALADSGCRMTHTHTHKATAQKRGALDWRARSLGSLYVGRGPLLKNARPEAKKNPARTLLPKKSVQRASSPSRPHPTRSPGRPRRCSRPPGASQPRCPRVRPSPGRASTASGGGKGRGHGPHLSLPAGSARGPRSVPTPEKASKHASKHASKQARTHASKQSNTQASKHASEQAHKRRTLASRVSLAARVPPLLLYGPETAPPPSFFVASSSSQRGMADLHGGVPSAAEVAAFSPVQRRVQRHAQDAPTATAHGIKRERRIKNGHGGLCFLCSVHLL
jgi:hypothetical protein